MKLLFCISCQDLFRLTDRERTCSCGETRGRYTNGVSAIYSGNAAVPIGISNSTFAQAIAAQPMHGDGARFEAFVIPEKCATFTREE